MTTSFYNGISGIKSSQSGMNVLSDNILNVDTIGYKGSSVGFSTIFSKTLSGGSPGDVTSEIGLGSQMDSTSLDTSQGTLQNTDNVFDLALNSQGWFGVQGTDNKTYYTRAGLFNKDANGYLTNESGNYLLGTPGGNVTPTTLDQTTLDAFGKYYGTSSTHLADAYAISNIQDVPLGSVASQTRIKLPDLLYFPPIPTTNVSYSANLDPTVNISSTQVDINSADISSSLDTANQTISINGTISNTSAALNPQPGDKALVTITDATGNTLSTSATLDSSLNWNIAGYDVSNLDTTNPLNVSAKLLTNQEIPNVEHFSSTVISPSGENHTLDLTFTKRVPQQSTGTTWDALVQILGPSQTYDPNVTYNTNTYKVDTTAKKIYPILDSQTGVLQFTSAGQLTSSTVPTLSNGGVPLTLDLGTPGTYTGLVSSANLSSTKNEQHNGYTQGFLKDYGMDGNGNVVAEFTNGRSVPIAKVAVYHFRNAQGLDKVGGNLFAASQNSGNPIFYKDSNGNSILGTQISSNKLEGSNVNTTTALTELIIMQKAFDASAKSITTSDQLIQNAINMKK
ncbi:MAG: flagellar hook-basal body complex protein [Sulfurospirillaceae bacterium]|nr:flagellar hook-basal body complex protein [Sulfurospirillaceae bacterium]